MSFTQHFKYLFNGGLDPATASPTALRERRTISSSILFLVPIGVLVIIINALRGLHEDIIIIACGLVFVSTALYVQSKLNAPRVAANMAVIGFWAIVVSVMTTSGMLGQTWLWLFAVPAVGALLGGLVSGVVWSVVCVCSIWAFSLLHVNGLLELDAQVQRFDTAYILGLAFEGSLVLILICAAVLIFRYAEQAAEQRLEETVKSLETEVYNRKLAEADARGSEQAKSAFLAAMSHELRTPLNGVIGALHLLHDTDNQAEKAEYAAIAKQSGELLLELINNVMDLSALESGTVKLEHIVIDLYALIENTCAPFRFQAQSKGLVFIVDRAKNTHRYIKGDPTRLRQVLINLIGNALKFTENGEIVIRVSVDDSQIHLCVSDTGIGIPAEAQASLFEPYVQAESSTTRKFGGSGLGLSIVKKLITNMRGSIKVKSEPGKGSSFFLNIPCELAEAPQQQAAKDSTPDIAPMNILIADDNAINRMVLSRMLEKDDHAVIAVTNGQEAADYLCSHEVDIVLMDIQMPELDGMSATRLIRGFDNAKANVPVVAITANTSNTDIERMHQAGINDYVAKPFRYEEIREKLLVGQS